MIVHLSTLGQIREYLSFRWKLRLMMDRLFMHHTMEGQSATLVGRFAACLTVARSLFWCEPMKNQLFVTTAELCSCRYQRCCLPSEANIIISLSC